MNDIVITSAKRSPIGKFMGSLSGFSAAELGSMAINSILSDTGVSRDKIDQVIIIYFKGPNSFTGEDVVEINCHGGLAIITKISKILESLGVRLAEPGEFTKRALMNDKIDLVQTEGLSDLINSETEKQRSLAMKSLSGDLSMFIQEINKKIKKIELLVMNSI